MQGTVYICVQTCVKACVTEMRLDMLEYVCQVLRAFGKGVFRPGDSFNAEYHALTDAEEITAQECYEILRAHCTRDGESGRPSFLVMANFVKFIEPQLVNSSLFEVLNIAWCLEGLENFKQVNMILPCTENCVWTCVEHGYVHRHMQSTNTSATGCI